MRSESDKQLECTSGDGFSARVAPLTTSEPQTSINEGSRIKEPQSRASRASFATNRLVREGLRHLSAGVPLCLGNAYTIKIGLGPG